MTKTAPKHLGDHAARFYRSIARTWQLETHHVELLRLACEQLDRAEAARLVIEEEGDLFLDRFAQPKPHPAVATHRDACLAFSRLLREFGIDAAAAADSRPPKLAGRYA